MTTDASDDATSEHSWDTFGKLPSDKALSLYYGRSANFPDEHVVMPSVLKITAQETCESLTGITARVFQCLQAPSLTHLDLSSRRIVLKSTRRLYHVLDHPLSVLHLYYWVPRHLCGDATLHTACYCDPGAKYTSIQFLSYTCRT